MAVRTGKQYIDGLRDDRTIFYRGRRVEDVTTEPEFAAALSHSALCYDIAQSQPNLSIDGADGDASSAFYRIPRSADDLRHRGQLIEQVSRMGSGSIVLKEVGSDALFALLRSTEGEALEKVQLLYDRVLRGDLAVAVAQTDVKGDRSKAPHQQADPDLYLRIVDEDADSITVRGAKCHTSFTANADELIVLPTRAMGPDDRDYAVSFSLPIAHPGLEFYVSPYSAGDAHRNAFEHPISSKHKLLESLTVFNDVRVPKERVYLGSGPIKSLAFGAID